MLFGGRIEETRLFKPSLKSASTIFAPIRYDSDDLRVEGFSINRRTLNGKMMHKGHAKRSENVFIELPCR